MRHITSARLRQLVSMPSAIEAVRGAFVRSSGGRMEQPTRLALEGGTALAMLAADRDGVGTVLKAVTVRPGNREADMPAVQAVVIWFDGPTGVPLALIEGEALTALRTGAASGVATELLAPADASVLAMIGAGAQAADQVRAVCAVRPIREVRVASRRPARAAEFAMMLGEEMSPVRVVARTVRDALDGAQVVCTATTSTEPLFAASDLGTDVHVNAIGAYTRAMCELPPGVFADAAVVAVDAIDAAMAEAGDILRAIRDGHLTRDRLVEIGTLAARPEAAAPGGRTVFKSVGVAAQDWALARLAVERAVGAGDDDQV